MKIILIVLRLTLLFLVSVAVAVETSGQDSIEQFLNKAEPRLRAIYDRREFRANEFRADWLSDGSGYTLIESNDVDQQELVQYDAATGRRTVLISSRQLVPDGTARPLRIHAYVFSPNSKKILLQTDSRNGRESRRTAVDYWLFKRSTKKLDKVVDGADPWNIGNSFSSEGGRIFYFRRRQLYGLDLQNRRSNRLTADNESDIRHVTWSPDGRRVGFSTIDDSKVRKRPMILPTDPTYPEVAWVRFARVGTPIPTFRVGVVNAEGGTVQWIEIPGEQGTYYIDNLTWAGNSNELLIEKMSRARETREFLLVNVETGSVTRAYQETDPAWVDASYRTDAGLEWIEDGREFVLMSEKGGWRQAFVMSRDGKELRLLTPGPSDIIARGKVDDERGWFYYLASPENATQRYLYRVRLDGKGDPQRVTPKNQTGSHRYDFSPDCRWAFHTWSTFDSPPVTQFIQLPEHRVMRVLEDNQELRKRVAPLISQPTEFLQLEIEGGVKMDAWMIKPRDFDSTKKYPVFVFVYGEPHSQTVLDDWYGGQRHTMFHRVISDLGYLVVSIDNRGTPAPKGAAWRRAVYGSLGLLSTKEQAAGLRALGRMRPYVDMSRVGIWGWSGGGSNTLNALFRQPDLYHVGIAVAPKPQPRLYNAWFQEIFMRTPEENPEGYRDSAPINFAEGLKGDLLIVHGTGETNTHIQITEGLVDRLIELGKQFDYMAYPNRNHGLHEGRGTDLHVRMLMTRYLVEHLPPGPR